MSQFTCHSAAFKISEREIGPGRREIRIEGELDLSVADLLVEAIGRSRDEQTLLDLGDCEFIDSTGIAVILRAHRDRAQDGAARLAVHSPSAQVLRVLTVTGLTGTDLVFGSLDEALAGSAAGQRP